MEQNSTYPLVLDPQRLAQSLQDITLKSQQIMLDSMGRMGTDTNFMVIDPVSLMKVYQEASLNMFNNLSNMLTPATLVANQTRFFEAQFKLWNDYMQLWQRTTRRAWFAEDVEPVAEPPVGDRRFKDTQWVENYVFDYIKQSYLIAASYMQAIVGKVEGLDDHTRHQMTFYARQWVDALAPTNFVATNPQVLRATLETGGENLINGFKNLLEDIERGKGNVRIKMTDLEAFQLGENVAITPGKVIHQNDLMQLIQYEPATETVYKQPLLIVPPWINKYYILDLKPKNSFIKWAVDQGHTVFVISWVNPDERHVEKTFDDYMLQGPIEALDIVEKATGENTVNAIGYCLGGTLLGATLAYMAAKGDNRIASATYFTTLLDFTEVGDLGVFIDEQQVTFLEAQMNQKGYLDGSNMASTFNMLRANDLIWSFVVNNYLLGRDPAAFDLLYWNSDATRMPAKMHSFYLRTMYMQNLLGKPGGISLVGVPIDLNKVAIPSYFISAREDHIAPWVATYKGARLLNGSTTFVLGGSGHIAGIINPPVANKYGYWTNSGLPETPDEWLASAERQEGSWWTHWANWVAQFAGEHVPARKPGNGRKVKALEDAPGSYVKNRIV
jgi:polyhydroxyalkanoate synthase subunit PhaC